MEVESGSCQVTWHMIAYDPIPYMPSNAEMWGTPVERALERIKDEHDHIIEICSFFHTEARITFEYDCIEDLVKFHKRDKTWVRKKFKEYLDDEHLHEVELITDWLMKKEAEELDDLIGIAFA